MDPGRWGRGNLEEVAQGEGPGVEDVVEEVDRRTIDGGWRINLL